MSIEHIIYIYLYVPTSSIFTRVTVQTREENKNNEQTNYIHVINDTHRLIDLVVIIYIRNVRYKMELEKH